MADEKWHDLDHITQIDPDGLSVDTVVRSDSPWFSGHFPGWPILPGIAMLSMVTQAVRYHEQIRNSEVRITGIKRVRFRLPIRPDDPITISLSRTGEDKEESYSFRISVREGIACTGIVSTERII